MSSCPAGSYGDSGGRTCLGCPAECEMCASQDKCTACRSSYYLAGSRCVGADSCPSGTYPSNSLRKCADCAEACLTCYGATSGECIECNFEQGFSKGSESASECYKVTCLDGYYPEVFSATKTIQCLACDSTCATCNGEGPYKCTQCKSGYSMTVEDGLTRCSKCPSGYTTKPNGDCQGESSCKLIEICGDGKNLGMNECDDGNNVDGDGCSSDCKVEHGYECYRQAAGPDICKNIIPLIAMLKVEDKNFLKVVFNKAVTVTGSFFTKL